MATTPIILPSDVASDTKEFCDEKPPWELKRKTTLPKVQEQTEKVLDVFIRRSLSMNDASPKRKYMIKIRRQNGRGKTISKCSDIEEENQFKRVPGSYREATRHSVMDDLEGSDSDFDDEPKSNSAPASLHYRVQLKPTEETLKKLEQLDLLPHNEQPTTKTKRKKKHSFSSIARSIQSFLKSPSTSKKKHDWEEEEKKDACKQEKEPKKGGFRESIRRKLRRKSLKDQGSSIDSILTPSSSTAGAITPSSLSSAEILDSPSRKYKKHRGFGDATTPGSGDVHVNGQISYGHKSADSALLFNIEIDDDLTINGGEQHYSSRNRSKHSDYASRTAAYRMQGDNKRESKESEKIKNYPDYVPPFTSTGGVPRDDTDGPNFSRDNDPKQPESASLRATSGPPRPTSLNVSPHTLRSFDRLGQVEHLGLNGITEVEIDRDGFGGSGTHIVRLSADVVEDCSGHGEDVSSDEEYKPFKDRSDKEKDAIYEKIAARLASIGDRVTLDHACGESYMADELIGAVGGSSSSSPKKIEEQEEVIEIPIDEEDLPFTETDARQLGLRLRHHGDRRSSSEIFSIPLNVLMSVVQNTRYDTFKGVASHLIGNDTSWRGLSLVLRLTGDAIKIAGRTPSVVTQIKDNSIKFINDKLAGWIASRGGWESVIEESISSSTSESEVD